MADTSTWVLDLSSDPPNIYNSEGTENLHNAFMQPYPYIFWYVTQDGNNVINNAFILNNTPSLNTPYPYIFWFTNSAGDDTIHYALFKNEPMGACNKCTNLNNITIPKSVKKIGNEMATNTSLTSVTIANDCEYTSTSFPQNCVVNFYPIN